MKKTIAIDMDNVIADVAQHYLDWYYTHYQVKLTMNDLMGRAEIDAFPEKGVVMKFLLTPNFFRTVPVVPGAIEALKMLSEYFEIYIVSAAM